MRLVGAAPAILAAMALASSAPAATMEDYGHYYADPGETNHVVVTGLGSQVRIQDSVPITILPGAMLPDQGSCAADSAMQIHCAYPSFLFSLGDKNDSFSYAGGAAPVNPNFPEPFSVYSEAGSDTMTGSPYNDSLLGDGSGTPDPTGNDNMFGMAGDDNLTDGGGAVNVLDGGPGADRLGASEGQNTLSGGPDNDVVNGGNGAETLSGGDGDDDMNGGGGTDNVLGEGGNDTVEGGMDQDVADGGPGNDSLTKLFHAGGCLLVPKLDGGPDTLIGGPGIDSVNVSCNTPILKLRDGEADKGSCASRVDSAVKEYDKADKIAGGACATLICKKKRKKKGKKSSASTAKKGKKKKRKCKPYKAPEPQFSLSRGLLGG